MAGLFAAVTLLVGAGFLATLDMGTALAVLGAIGAVLSAAMFLSMAAVFKGARVLPRVRVREGVVEVFRRYHAGGARPLTTFRLSEARWHRGRLREDDSCRGRGGAIVNDRPAVILHCSPLVPALPVPHRQIACGSSPEMIRRWCGFLRIAGVPEGR